MSLPTATKIEERAISALKNIVDEHFTMLSSFNSADKEMAWDGYIFIFVEGSKGASKKDLDDIKKEAKKNAKKKKVITTEDDDFLENFYQDVQDEPETVLQENKEEQKELLNV